MDLSHSPINLTDYATAHFLTIGCSNGFESSITVSDANCDCNYLAVYDEYDMHLGKHLCSYHTGGYREHSGSLFVPNEAPADLREYFQISRIGGWYFTERHRPHVAINEKQQDWFLTSDPSYVIKPEPEFLVKSLRSLGRRTIKIPCSVAYYTPDDIKKIFINPDANAYQIIQGFKKRDKNYQAVVEYYQAEEGFLFPNILHGIMDTSLKKCYYSKTL